LMESSTIRAQIEALTAELNSIRERIKDAKEERTRIIEELKTLRAQRAKLLSDLAGLKERYRSVESRRHELIESFKNLANERKARLAELKELRELLQAKNSQIREMEKQARTPTSILREEINRLEWQLQTKVLSLEEENRIINKIKRLNELLAKAEALKKEKNSTLEMKALLSSLRIQVEDLSKKLGNLREEINKLSQERDSLRSRIEEIVNKNVELKTLINEKQEQVNKLSTMIEELVRKQGEIREKLSQLHKDLERSKISQIIDAKKQEIMEKLKKGGKLTFEELKILYGEPEDFESE